ncbi:hypothetical protein QP101_06595 [Aerococcus urinae]|uniref:hypothetical protein n=1 Tax=Aerococcus urinae TaxID=1376 RepID=UPI002550DC81|nr:hypothetical protein [Aerococcus urinae]MDK6371745.1 hypothetical protein [Aerococcus urinae]
MKLQKFSLISLSLLTTGLLLSSCQNQANEAASAQVQNESQSQAHTIKEDTDKEASQHNLENPADSTKQENIDKDANYQVNQTIPIFCPDDPEKLIAELKVTQVSNTVNALPQDMVEDPNYDHKTLATIEIEYKNIASQDAMAIGPENFTITDQNGHQLEAIDRVDGDKSVDQGQIARSQFFVKYDPSQVFDQITMDLHPLNTQEPIARIHAKVSHD